MRGIRRRTAVAVEGRTRAGAERGQKTLLPFCCWAPAHILPLIELKLKAKSRLDAEPSSTRGRSLLWFDVVVYCLVRSLLLLLFHAG
jgi:hypothetical protein